MSGYFELKKAVSGQFMFNLKAGNNEVILTSEMYQAKRSAEEGVESVQVNSLLDERFERLMSKADQPYFNLKGGNGQVIGVSEMYSSPAAMETGVASVKANGSSKTVKDLTLA